jgi:hypothetical protein
MIRPMRWLTASALLAALAATADARSEKTFAYTRESVWPAAVRFLVVDEHAKLTDKDADAGYLLFELREDGKTFRGALELGTVVVDGRTQVRFILQIADRPSWVEIAMLRRLERKLRAELGAPAPPPAPKEPAQPPKDEPAKDEHGPPVSPTP